MATLTISELLVLASVLSGQPMADDGALPIVVYKTPCEIINQFERTKRTPLQCERRMREGPYVRAMYSSFLNTVTLSKETDLNSIDDVAIVVHELVHYLQARNGFFTSATLCQLETEAYNAQNLIYVLNDQPPPISEANIRIFGKCGN